MPDYKTPQAFHDLFFDFTGHAHPNYPKNRRSIAQDLAQSISEHSDTSKAGPLIIATSVGIYVYSGEKSHQLISSAEYRAAPNSGFYEVTSISHIGPAIAYLGLLKKQGNNAWKNHLEPMLAHLKAIREINSRPLQNHWLTQLDCDAWQGREQAIKNMIDYACSLAGNYLININQNKTTFSSENLVENFLEINSNNYPISFNTIMIGTFALAGLQSAYNIFKALNKACIHWKYAKIILHNLAGTNYSATLTAGSNWLYPLITSIAQTKLDPKRIIIAPFAPMPKDVGEKQLSNEAFEQLSQHVWGSIFSRPIVTDAAFAHVKDIVIPYRSPIPGDYEITSADQIDHFIQRLKFSTGNIKESLSNTVGFWLAGEAKNKNWVLSRMAIPGLTHGLPKGMTGYPDNAPKIG